MVGARGAGHEVYVGSRENRYCVRNIPHFAPPSEAMHPLVVQPARGPQPALTVPYATHSRPLSVFMALVGAYSEAEERERSTSAMVDSGAA